MTTEGGMTRSTADTLREMVELVRSLPRSEQRWMRQVEKPNAR
jgi:hypothetical protein